MGTVKLLAAACLAALSVLTAAWSLQFDAVTASLCVRDQFAELLGPSSCRVCAMLCSLNQRCQAFTTADGPCQLFVFDKCSKSVRNCSCSRRGRLFVKRQPGLEPGALCPSGYGGELCGVKYRLLNHSDTWANQRPRCEAEPGLAIMADVTSATEISHISQLHGHTSGHALIFLGGFQPAGSPESPASWLWISCNISIAAELWGPGEPNGGIAEDVTTSYVSLPGLFDHGQNYTFPALCECVSPFD